MKNLLFFLDVMIKEIIYGYQSIANGIIQQGLQRPCT